MLHILGAGSLGLLWAARLIQAGLPVTLLVRDTAARQHWQQTGDQMTLEYQGQHHQIPVHIETPDSHTSPIQHLIVATKSHASLQAVQRLQPRLCADASILLLQNGLGSQQQISALLSQQVLYASVTDGAWRRTPCHVVWAGKGVTQIGDPRGLPFPNWLSALPGDCIDWQWQADILQVLWVKLAINCAINPYTVLHDCRNGDVPQHARAELPLLISELQQLLRAQNLEIEPDALSERIHAVIQATANNSSSMRQDVHAGRPTEIDYITGFACNSAMAAGLHLPVLMSLHTRLKTHLATLGLYQQ